MSDKEQQFDSDPNINMVGVLLSKNGSLLSYFEEWEKMGRFQEKGEILGKGGNFRKREKLGKK